MTNDKDECDPPNACANKENCWFHSEWNTGEWKEVPYSITSCWFCRKDKPDKDWLFSCEFDCYLHEKCLKEAIKNEEPGDPETKILKNEFYGEENASL